MSPFEYVTVLISIVLSLGITKILTGLARIIRHRNTVKLYWPHLLWILFILFLHVQEWWIMYELKTFGPWRLPVFLFVMLYPINLYLLAKLLFPRKVRGKNLKVYYFNNYPQIFLLLVLSALLSIAYNLMILNLSIGEQSLQFLLALSFSVIVYKRFSQEWIHKTASLVVIMIMVVTIFVEWNVWLIG